LFRAPENLIKIYDTTGFREAEKKEREREKEEGRKH